MKDKKVLFHCYTGTQKSADKIFSNGWNIAFSGIVTFKRSGELAEILKNGDIEKMFFETDSPFLSPVPFRGRINTPAKVRYVYEFASEILQVESEYLQKIVKRNFENFFGVHLF
jgi:TatD DNase family protein